MAAARKQLACEPQMHLLDSALVLLPEMRRAEAIAASVRPNKPRCQD